MVSTVLVALALVLATTLGVLAIPLVKSDIILPARLQVSLLSEPQDGTNSGRRVTRKVCSKGPHRFTPCIDKFTVERRRREVINEGIENIAKIVPGNEKNKGAILQRTAQYIQELQTEVAGFTKERQTYDVTIPELTRRVSECNQAMKQAIADANKWQQRCRDAGLQFDDYDGSGPDFDSLGTADLDAIGS